MDKTLDARWHQGFIHLAVLSIVYLLGGGGGSGGGGGGGGGVGGWGGDVGGGDGDSGGCDGVDGGGSRGVLVGMVVVRFFFITGVLSLIHCLSI